MNSIYNFSASELNSPKWQPELRLDRLDDEGYQRYQEMRNESKEREEQITDPVENTECKDDDDKLNELENFENSSYDTAPDSPGYEIFALVEGYESILNSSFDSSQSLIQNDQNENKYENPSQNFSQYPFECHEIDEDSIQDEECSPNAVEDDENDVEEDWEDISENGTEVGEEEYIILEMSPINSVETETIDETVAPDDLNNPVENLEVENDPLEKQFLDFLSSFHLEVENDPLEKQFLDFLSSFQKPNVPLGQNSNSTLTKVQSQSQDQNQESVPSSSQIIESSTTKQDLMIQDKGDFSHKSLENELQSDVDDHHISVPSNELIESPENVIVNLVDKVKIIDNFTSLPNPSNSHPQDQGQSGVPNSQKSDIESINKEVIQVSDVTPKSPNNDEPIQIHSELDLRLSVPQNENVLFESPENLIVNLVDEVKIVDSDNVTPTSLPNPSNSLPQDQGQSGVPNSQKSDIESINKEVIQVSDVTPKSLNNDEPIQIHSELDLRLSVPQNENVLFESPENLIVNLVDEVKIVDSDNVTPTSLPNPSNSLPQDQGQSGVPNSQKSDIESINKEVIQVSDVTPKSLNNELAIQIKSDDIVCVPQNKNALIEPAKEITVNLEDKVEIADDVPTVPLLNLSNSLMQKQDQSYVSNSQNGYTEIDEIGVVIQETASEICPKYYSSNKLELRIQIQSDEDDIECVPQNLFVESPEVEEVTAIIQGSSSGAVLAESEVNHLQFDKLCISQPISSEVKSSAEDVQPQYQDLPSDRLIKESSSSPSSINILITKNPFKSSPSKGQIQVEDDQPQLHESFQELENISKAQQPVVVDNSVCNVKEPQPNLNDANSKEILKCAETTIESEIEDENSVEENKFNNLTEKSCRFIVENEEASDADNESDEDDEDETGEVLYLTTKVIVYRCNICQRNDFTSEEEFAIHFIEIHKFSANTSFAMEDMSEEEEIFNDVMEYERRLGRDIPGRILPKEIVDEDKWDSLESDYSDSSYSGSYEQVLTNEEVEEDEEEFMQSDSSDSDFNLKRKVTSKKSQRNRKGLFDRRKTTNDLTKENLNESVNHSAGQIEQRINSSKDEHLAQGFRKEKQSSITGYVPKSQFSLNKREESIRCTICQEVLYCFYKKRTPAPAKTLIYHNLRCHSNPPISCLYCSQHFLSEELLNQHFQSGASKMSTPKMPFRCFYCDKVFPTGNCMLFHRKTHENWPWEKKLCRCTICNKIFKGIKFLVNHIEQPTSCKSQHPKRQYLKRQPLKGRKKLKRPTGKLKSTRDFILNGVRKRMGNSRIQSPTTATRVNEIQPLDVKERRPSAKTPPPDLLPIDLENNNPEPLVVKVKIPPPGLLPLEKGNSLPKKTSTEGEKKRGRRKQIFNTGISVTKNMTTAAAGVIPKPALVGSSRSSTTTSTQNDNLHCPKCNTKYKHQKWLQNHIEKCTYNSDPPVPTFKCAICGVVDYTALNHLMHMKTVHFPSILKTITT